MKIRVLIYVCLLPLLLGGCATTKEYGQKVSSWIGHTVDDLYSKLGKPSSTETLTDGGKIVSYERKEVVKDVSENKATQPLASNDGGVTKSANRNPNEQISAGKETASTKTRTVSCTTRYKTDNTGVVRSWTIDGNGCKAHEEPYSLQQ